mmetsp:Transcript_110695/g.253601  ORF Transcript_110695/g.253601 Transcript_110695/m.253601 type:complete len:221 (+) Transcript_110695:783-1445(+)
MQLSVSLCKKIQYGMNFAHVRLYYPPAAWQRVTTVNCRDFARSLGIGRVEQIPGLFGDPPFKQRLLNQVDILFADEWESLREASPPVPSLRLETLRFAASLDPEEKQEIIASRYEIQAATEKPTDPTDRFRRGGGYVSSSMWKKAAYFQTAFNTPFFALDFGITSDGKVHVEVQADDPPPAVQKVMQMQQHRQQEKSRDRPTSHQSESRAPTPRERLMSG